MADTDPLANDSAFRAIAKVWEDLGRFCEAALREALRGTPAVNCQALGIAADDFAALTNQLDAALELGALDRIEAAAREMTTAITVGPNDLRRPGITETDLAFLGALMMMRGQLRILDDSRAGEGPAAIALPTLTDDPDVAPCDFCGAARPTWYFRAEPFELPHPGRDSPAVFGDRWYACDACRPLVGAADWKGLAARLGFPWPLPQTIKTAWLMFGRHRRGDAQRVPR
ncbi:hypothetical protein [Actinomadura sp. NPDC048394]|uniref:hypothetical protein n=1 Tax=Actinomadura sp. NPDC048394 TaxID=3158223 RepID=UPI0033EE89D4